MDPMLRPIIAKLEGSRITSSDDLRRLGMHWYLDTMLRRVDTDSAAKGEVMLGDVLVVANGALLPALLLASL